MDLHGNVSDALFGACDLLTCYRTAPHVDVAETRERAARNLVEVLISGRGRPAKSLVHVPILLPGEKTSTREEPAASIYALTWDAEAKEGIIDAAIWVGFAWADEPRCKAAVVVTGWDPALVNEGARRLAEAYWQARDQFEFVAPTGSMGECLEHARRAARPYFISDTGDNPGAGGAGDGTSALGELAKWQRSFEGGRALFASIPTPWRWRNALMLARARM